MIVNYEEQSILLGSPVDDQLREALAVLEGQVAPDLLVKLRDLCQLDLLLKGKVHNHLRGICL